MGRDIAKYYSSNMVASRTRSSVKEDMSSVSTVSHTSY